MCVGIFSSFYYQFQEEEFDLEKQEYNRDLIEKSFCRNIISSISNYVSTYCSQTFKRRT